MTAQTKRKNTAFFDAVTDFKKKYPSLSVCLTTTVIAFAVVFLVASAGWPGQITSNCYEDYLVTADCYCEKLRGDKPGDAWFAQPMNTISNLWFVLAGLLMAYSSDSRTFPNKEWWENKKNPFTQDSMYTTTFALAACLVGIGSVCLHASFTAWGRQVDMIAMYCIAAFTLTYPFVKNKTLSREQAIDLYSLECALLVYWTLAVGTPEQTRKLFSTLITASWAIELFHVDQEIAKQNKNARRILMSNIFLFVVAVLIWKASESGAPYCYPDSLWQGHSLWHMQAAMAIFGQYCFYLSEDLSEADKKNGQGYLFEDTPLSMTLTDTSSESDSISECST